MTRDTALVYIRLSVFDKAWHPPMTQQWDFHLVKPIDTVLDHAFPTILTGCVFKKLHEKLQDREFLHIIKKTESSSYSRTCMTRNHPGVWGAEFQPNMAPESKVYRTLPEVNEAWLDVDSHMLFYEQQEHGMRQCIQVDSCVLFGGSVPICVNVR
jgi:hypothetical protein